MQKQVSHSSHVRIVETDKDGLVKIGRPVLRSVNRKTAPYLADELLTWVTGSADPAVRKIVKILELLVELDSMRSTAEAHCFIWQGREFEARVAIPKGGGLPERSKRESELRSSLNTLLRRYRFAPLYWAALGDFHLIGWWSGNERPDEPDSPGDSIDFTEDDAVLRIMDLARDGLLGRIRRCDCKDWFFARFSHQKFCCTRCQQNYYRSSEEYRANRRIYMKNLREIHRKTCPVSRARKTSKSSVERKTSR
jgi:hypothetical protein